MTDPCKHTKWHPNSRSKVLHSQVIGDLAQEIAAPEDGIDDGDVVAHHVQVFPHSGDIGIVQIGSVKAKGGERQRDGHR